MRMKMTVTMSECDTLGFFFPCISKKISIQARARDPSMVLFFSLSQLDNFKMKNSRNSQRH